jgi:hypothetical protein
MKKKVPAVRPATKQKRIEQLRSLQAPWCLYEDTDGEVMAFHTHIDSLTFYYHVDMCLTVTAKCFVGVVDDNVTAKSFQDKNLNNVIFEMWKYATDLKNKKLEELRRELMRMNDDIVDLSRLFLKKDENEMDQK